MFKNQLLQSIESLKWFLFFIMGSCWEKVFTPKALQDETPCPQQLIDSVTIKQSTQNDKFFTYYLSYPNLQRILDTALSKVTNQSVTNPQPQQKDTKISELIFEQRLKLESYLTELNNQYSELTKKLFEDSRMISGNKLLIRLEIQQLGLSSEVKNITLQVNTNKKENFIANIRNEQNLDINMQIDSSAKSMSDKKVANKQTKLNKYFQFPVQQNSKIHFIANPTGAEATITIKDLMPNIVILQIFKFKKVLVNAGAISVRIQYVQPFQQQRRRLIQILSLKKHQLTKLLQNNKAWQGLFSQSSQTNKQQSIKSYYDNNYIV